MASNPSRLAKIYHNIRRFYKSLKIDREMITEERILSHPKCAATDVSDLLKPLSTHWLITTDEHADAVYELYHLQKIDGGFRVPNYFDACFDIKVYNATYAEIDGFVELERIGDYFTSPDFTLDNPLFYNGQFKIATDGTHSECKMLTFHFDAVKKFNELTKHVYFNYIPSKNTFLVYYNYGFQIISLGDSKEILDIYSKK